MKMKVWHQEAETESVTMHHIPGKYQNSKNPILFVSFSDLHRRWLSLGILTRTIICPDYLIVGSQLSIVFAVTAKLIFKSQKRKMTDLHLQIPMVCSDD